MGSRATGPPRLRLGRVAEPGLAVSAASRLSHSPPRPRPPAPPRCLSEEDAPRVRAAAPAAASLQHRLTAASAPVPAPETRALDHTALTDEQCSQCKGAEAASPAAPQAHSLPRAGPRRPGSAAPALLPASRGSRAPGPPTRRTPNPASVSFSGTQEPSPLAPWFGALGPAPSRNGRGGLRAAQGLGRAEGEAVDPDLGRRGSRAGAGPGPQRPLPAMLRDGPRLRGD